MKDTFLLFLYNMFIGCKIIKKKTPWQKSRLAAWCVGTTFAEPPVRRLGFLRQVVAVKNKQCTIIRARLVLLCKLLTRAIGCYMGQLLLLCQSNEVSPHQTLCSTVHSLCPVCVHRSCHYSNAVDRVWVGYVTQDKFSIRICVTTVTMCSRQGRFKFDARRRLSRLVVPSTQCPPLWSVHNQLGQHYDELSRPSY